jgi:phage shock protein PspC (stress-responsive transcriptional regulator)
MNKVVNINLNGLVFSIDDTAYEQLKRYIDGLKAHFGNTDGASEIIQDIEARIAELLQVRLTDKYTVVQLSDIQEVIALMGNPMEIEGEEEQAAPKQKRASFDQEPIKKLRRDPQHKTLGGVCAGLANYFGVDIMIPRILFLVAFFTFGSGLLVYIIMWLAIPEASSSDLATIENQSSKRLYRNPDNKKFGGVCSGLAEYMGVDAVWLRLGFLVALFCFGTGFLAYIILWIAIHEAKTSAEKLQMKGETIDVNNIEKEVRSAIHRTSATVTSSPFGEIVRMFAKIISKLIGAAFLIVSLLLIGVIVFLWNYSFANILDKLDINEYYSYFQYGFGLFVFSVAALIMVMGIKFLFHTRIKVKIMSTVLFLCAVIGLASMLYFGLQYRKSVRVKNTVKEHIATNLAPDTVYVNVHRLYEDDLDSDNDNLTIRINKHTSSRSFKVGQMKDWVKVFYNTRLSIKPSVNDSLYFYLIKSARGENETIAANNARDIGFQSGLNQNVLTIDEGISIESDRPFKYQQVSAKLKVPVGTIIKVDPGVMKMINSNYEADFDLGETFKMTKDGLRCLDCVDTEDDSDEDINIDWNVDDDDGEVNIKIRKDPRSQSYIKDSTGVVHYGKDNK